ncbi:mediator complex subunit MED14-domain-containing protein [Lipomyces tetrasporus]|uniref:Mediator of RNA polymerase II transcription subunit 14 n=1 Tax=Lipomyces tetrasporus TaxID=54092 RepID=A0AAD7QWF3_9ASCO|nr:mediator complex subunit MED14-domain-containing protein [Lipomyces tetrasporus]KAJ8102525.1 mediator complex subunit MED14-domain-containing protein [Lipomyces tetrasporus]
MMSVDDHDHPPPPGAQVVVKGQLNVADEVYPSIPHISENFIPLSVVASRLVENTYSELVNILETLPAANDTTKKRKFLNFLIHTRQQYIKLLVLTQWSRNARDISKVIDVVSWLSGQKNCFSNVVWSLQAVKHDLGSARLRNPDIATALEVFVLGKPRLSSFNYVPPKPLSPQTILDTLHDLNVLLSLRLALSDNIPVPFQNYKIANGRVTFCVEGDFEVDLGIADDNKNSRFFLIDFRYIFKPISTVTPAIRASLERIGNEILITKGLDGLYEYLHNFTLSYKLLILQQQLVRLANGIWTGTLNISYFAERQTIAIQYWAEQPGRKAVAEVGVLQSKVLGVQWIPRDFSAETFTIDQSEISAQTVLSQVIIYHIQQLLAAILTAFLSSPIYKSLSDLITPVSDTKLKIKLTPSLTTYLTVEHLTGRMVLEGTTDLIASAEQALNAQTDIQSSTQILTTLRHLSIQREIEDLVKSAGWDVIKLTNIRADDIRQKYGVGVRQTTTIRQRHWIRGWFIVVTISDSTISLWFSEFKSAEGGWSIAWNEALALDALDTLYSPEKLNRLAAVTSGRITFHIIANGLQERNIPYELIPPPTDIHGSTLELPSLQFASSAVTKSTWAKSAFKLEFVPSESEEERNAVIVTGSIEQSAAVSSVSANSSDVMLDGQNGHFTLKFYVPPNSQILQQILERLGQIERSVSFIETLQTFNIKLDEISLNRISFEYAPDLRMAITISVDRKMTLELSDPNPHRRIQFFLQDVLDNEGLRPLLAILPATLPLLRFAGYIDSSDAYFITHSTKSYRIIYYAQKHAIDIELKYKDGRPMVYVTDSSGDIPGFKQADVCSSIWTSNSSGMVGLQAGIACEIEVVEELLSRVHSAISS